MDVRRTSLWELNFAVVLWAGTALFAKWIALPAFQVTALRSVVAAVALGLVLRWQRVAWVPRTRRDLGLLFISGAMLAAHWVTYFQSIQLSTVAIGILSLHTYPVMTAVVEPRLFGERLRGVDVGLALTVLLGVAVLVPDWSPRHPVTQGVLLGVLSAACFAARNILTRRVVQTHGGGTVTLYQLLTSVALLLPVALWAGDPVDGRAAGQLVLLGVLFTALPHTLYTNSLRHLKARTVGIIATLLPIYGALTAALLLGEMPAARTVVGGALILVAVFIETWRVLRDRS